MIFDLLTPPQGPRGRGPQDGQMDEVNYNIPFAVLKMCGVNKRQDFSQECVTEKQFSYFSTKRYVVGTQRTISMRQFFLSTQNIYLKLWVRKYLQFYREFFCLSKPV